MIKSIKLKLWLTLFVTLIFSLSLLLSVTYFSVKQRFLEYATHQILDRLEPLEEAVIELYSKENSLSPFIDTPARWTQLRDATYRQYLKEQNRRLKAPLDPSSRDWSERESVEKKLQPNQRAFFQHLVLFDHNKQLVAGRLKENAKYVDRTLSLNGEVIAYISYIKPKAFLRSVDKLFVDQQIKAFGLLSVVMIFAALLVTLFVARWLVVPLSLLANSAKQVAAGNFSARVNFKADDELGKLCQNFDEMAQTLEKNEITRKQWVADISHEMRTPLSVLKAQIEAMEDGIRPSNPDNFALLRGKVDSLSTIIDDLYELSLADLGALKLHKNTLQLTEVLAELENEFHDKFKQKSIQVTINNAKQDMTVFAERKRIKQVLSNLFENTYRYTDPGGQLVVSTKQNNQNTTIVIEDSAPAVPSEALHRIFDRLYRLEESRNRSTGGAGLGLSICRGIIESHGGTIEAKPAALGGLRQTITLPNYYEQ